MLIQTRVLIEAMFEQSEAGRTVPHAELLAANAAAAAAVEAVMRTSCSNPHEQV